MRLVVFLCFLLSFNAFSQEDLEAKEYYKNGEFEKALLSYQKLYKKNPNSNYFIQLIKSHQQLEHYNTVENLLQERLTKVKDPRLFVELGYNFKLKNDTISANVNFNKAIDFINQNPNYAYTIGRTFEDHSLLEQAIQVYEKGLELSPNPNFKLQLARIYGEQGHIEKMFKSYLEFVEINENETYINSIKRAFNEFISENSENENNIMLRKILLKKIQEEPKLLWNEMLSWLFIQQKDYNKAFVQEKAIFSRQPESLDRINELALVALNDKNYNIAQDIYTYLSETAQELDTKLNAHYNVLQIETQLATLKDLDAIDTKYQNLFKTYGKFSQTLQLQIAYAHFLAFNKHLPKEATTFLKETLQLQLTVIQEAQVKIELADILVLQEKFNEALIYYTQIQRSSKNSTISQEARYKVARTSFFKGDFKWAESQLKVLKASTSQLIANDALDLMLLITDNKYEDSTQLGLKLYAKADLMDFQNKPQEAITLLEEILTQHKGKTIEDQALFKQAQLFEKNKQYDKAIKNYQAIITNFKDDILADDAYYYLAELYNNILSDPEKAKENYEQIIFNHQDSIYFVEARKKFRMLRGDAIN